MTRDEANRRADEGWPLESAWEIVFALQRIQDRRAAPKSLRWYLLNRLMHIATEYAKAEDESPEAVARVSAKQALRSL